MDVYLLSFFCQTSPGNTPEPYMQNQVHAEVKLKHGTLPHQILLQPDKTDPHEMEQSSPGGVKLETVRFVEVCFSFQVITTQC